MESTLECLDMALTRMWPPLPHLEVACDPHPVPHSPHTPALHLHSKRVNVQHLQKPVDGTLSCKVIEQDGPVAVITIEPALTLSQDRSIGSSAVPFARFITRARLACAGGPEKYIDADGSPTSASICDSSQLS